MNIFRCKMCDANMKIVSGQSVAKCEYCGTEQTIPSFYNDQKERLYDRAEHLRKMDDYDGAKRVFEEILSMDPTDAESYWALVLCEFGIEYVEDEKTRRRIPTINRIQYTSVLTNENYLLACKYADEGQRILYEQYAKEIEEIQKRYLEVVSTVDDYDVFICYKETDQNGRRTQDSVLANELYYELTEAGFRVFYARITLEDKLGVEYEPYIFAALQSAKIMVVIGTKPEYFQAVWVKNEWSRFLTLIENRKDKMLIPAYKNMDPYELPEEFRTFHCMNMEELGFVQELVRGVKKIVGTNEVTPIETEIHVRNNQIEDLNYLLEKAMIIMKDGRFDLADGMCEDVLNQDSRYAKAYFLKFLISSECLSEQEYMDKLKKAVKNVSIESAIACEADTALIDKAVEMYYVPFYFLRTEIRECFKYDRTYHYVSLSPEAESLISSKKLNLLKRAALFSEGEEHKEYDSLQKKIQMMIEDILSDDENRKKEACEKYEEYMRQKLELVKIKSESEAAKLQNAYEKNCKVIEQADNIYVLETAIAQFQDYEGYKDSNQKIQECYEKIEEIKRIQKEKEEEQESRKERRHFIRNMSAVVLIGFALFYFFFLRYEIPFQIGRKYLREGDYKKARICFERIENWHPVSVELKKCVKGLEQEAQMAYQEAYSEYTQGKYENARAILQPHVDYFRDPQCSELYTMCEIELMKTASVGDVVYWGLCQQDQDEFMLSEPIEWIVLEKNQNEYKLTSKYCLTYLSYKDERTDQDGKRNTFQLKKWLEQKFYSDVFLEEEKKQIVQKKYIYREDKIKKYTNSTHLAMILLYGEGNDYCNDEETYYEYGSSSSVFLLNREDYQKYGTLLGECSYTDYAKQFLKKDTSEPSFWLGDTIYKEIEQETKQNEQKSSRLEWTKTVYGYCGLGENRICEEEISCSGGVRPSIIVSLQDFE